MENEIKMKELYENYTTLIGFFPIVLFNQILSAELLSKISKTFLEVKIDIMPSSVL